MKNIISKNKNIILFVSFFFLFLPFLGVAENGALIESGDDVIEIFRRIGVWLFRVFLVATVIAFIITGFFYLTASGNPNNMQRAHNMLKYALIGVVVALLAGSAVGIMESFLDVSNGNS